MIKAKLKFPSAMMCILIAISCVLGFFSFRYNLLIATVPSSSMEDTIPTGAKIAGNRRAYAKKLPERFDIVICLMPDSQKGETTVKRIIGLPNEKLEIIEGKVYINDSIVSLTENYIKAAGTDNFGPYEIPDGCYFVMGDNRNMSADSRNWSNKYVSKDMILAKVEIIK